MIGSKYAVLQNAPFNRNRGGEPSPVVSTQILFPDGVRTTELERRQAARGAVAKLALSTEGVMVEVIGSR
jgi:hypothetical protein